MNRVCLLSLVLAILAASLAAAADRPPNAVFMLVDDMGYADLGCYGATDIKTPHIDSLARDGVRFTDFYSNGPVCTPTRCGFITGRYQQRVGLEWAIGPNGVQRRRQGDEWVAEPDILKLGLAASETSIARMLKGAGYGTACFGKWHLGYQPQFGANAHGFDEYFGILRGNADMYSHLNRDGTSDLFENTAPVKREGYLTDLITERAVEYIGREGRQPFLLYVPYNAVHWPFQPPDKPGDVRNNDTWLDGDRRAYAAMLQRVDDGVGRILAALAKAGVADDTLVIFSNDNGGERYSSNRPLFHHKATLWEGGIRVPCLMRWPGRLPAGKVTRQVGITMDLTATILAAAAVKLPEGRRLDGIDLLPTIAGNAGGQGEVERTLFWRIDRYDRKQKAVRHGKWKYVLDGPIEQLFDLAADIGERRDLQYEHPDVLAQLRRLLDDWETELARNPTEFVVN